MFSMAMVTFREGLEALLIIAITLTYLRATQRRQLVGGVYWGIGTAAVLSLGLGIVLARAGGMSPLTEGVLACVAALCVISCTVHMLRHGKRMAAEIRGAIHRATLRSGTRAWLTVFLFTVLMIGREGVEAATMIASLAVAGDMPHLLAGALIGVMLATLVAWTWARFGSRVDLGLLFRVTAVFMVLFSIQLLIYAFHELTEANVLPGLDNEFWHVATEPYGPEGQWGAWLSYSLVLAPAALLLWGSLGRKPRT